MARRKLAAEKFAEYERLLAEAKNIVERLNRKDLSRLIAHYNKIFQRREAAKEQ
jgi:exonuclease VII small subunit